MKPRPFPKEMLARQEETYKRWLIGDKAYESIQRRKRENVGALKKFP